MISTEQYFHVCIVFNKVVNQLTLKLPLWLSVGAVVHDLS